MEPTTQDLWMKRQAIELLAQHIPFESDPQVKAECIEELRTLVRAAASQIDRAVFGFEARQELRRLGLWDAFYDSTPPGPEDDGGAVYGHGRWSFEFLDGEDDEP